LGLLRDCVNDLAVTEFLVAVQDRLFTIGSQLAVGKDAVSMKLPNIHLSDIETIESKIDEMDATLPAMTHFVLPGGHPTVSHCHIARCICRRAERNIAHLAENEPVAEVILAYMNRLSDYLFVLSRKLVLDLGVTETPWIPKND
jgi:cob(I)alamin adenosyltransferase